MARSNCRIIIGDALTELKKLQTESVHCCVTSPPYWQLRDYGVKGQIGLEATAQEFVKKLVRVFREVRRVLRSDGTLWLNLGDTYMSSWVCSRVNSIGSKAMPRDQRRQWRQRLTGGLKEKDLVGIPWRIALALQADGWFLRCDIIWHKPNPLPESTRDRPTRAHEYVFLLSKSRKYYYDIDAIREPHGTSRLRKARLPWAGPTFQHHPSGESQTLKPHQMFHPRGRNKRSVWTIPIRGFRGNHFSTFPERLVEPCILAGCPKGGTVLDPFSGKGTTMLAANQQLRRAIGIELSPVYSKPVIEQIA